MKISILEILIILFPSILGYSLSSICPVSKNSGIKVSFRPPSYIFAIVWPILFLLLGISMMIAFRNNINLFWLYFLTTIIIVSWIVFYSCLGNKNIGAYTLIFSVILIGICIFFSKPLQRILMSFLLAWCIFATILNLYELYKIV